MGAGACVGAALATLAGLGAAAAPRSAPLVQELGAAEFLDSIGINTHMSAAETGPGGTSYGNVDAVLRELGVIGVRHVRDILLIGKDLPKLELIHQRLGINFDLVYDYYGEDGGSALLTAALANVQRDAPMIEAIEGPNEPDQFGIHYNGLSRAAAVVQAQRELFHAVRSNDRLARVQVYCTALSYPAGGLASNLGDLSPVCDQANSHDYVENHSTGRYLPLDYLQTWTGYPTSFVPNRPQVITEGGWSTCPANIQGVSEAVQAKYTLTYLLDTALLGIKRVYLYDLSDDGPDPGFTNPENHYGLFRYDGTPKPAATMMARVRSLLETGQGQAPSGRLDYTVQNLPENGHSLVLRRADGQFVVALWTEAYLWSRTGQSEIDHLPTKVSLQFGGLPRSISMADPVIGTAPVAVPLDHEMATIPVPDHPIFLVVNPAS